MNEIQKYTSAEIKKFTTVKEAVKIKDIAEAAEIFYKAQGAFEKAQEAQELKLRCIRQAGTILLPPEQGGGMVRSEGGRPEKNSLVNLTSFQEALSGLCPYIGPEIG